MALTETLTRIQDPTLIDLIDSVVAAVDINRVEEIERVREALESFGAARLFDDELRLNGQPIRDDGLCVCEGWL